MLRDPVSRATATRTEIAGDGRIDEVLADGTAITRDYAGDPRWGY